MKPAPPKESQSFIKKAEQTGLVSSREMAGLQVQGAASLLFLVTIWFGNERRRGNGVNKLDLDFGSKTEDNNTVSS